MSEKELLRRTNPAGTLKVTIKHDGEEEEIWATGFRLMETGQSEYELRI